MITQLSIVHFKAIASATIPLGPITVLVGPNDSGKSTILQALMALSRAGGPLRLGVDQLLDCPVAIAATNGDVTTSINLSADGSTTLLPNGKRHSYRYATGMGPKTLDLSREIISWDGQSLLDAELGRPAIIEGKQLIGESWQAASTELSHLTHSSGTAQPMYRAIAEDLRATLLRLDARSIARASPLGAELLPDGSGLVGIVDDLLTSGVGDEQITQVNEIIRRLSPHVRSVAAKRHPGGKELHFALRSGTVVPASQMSDGIVLAAALAVIALGSRTPRLLIEEPENGLHPRQLKIVADTIRSIAETQGTQIVLTTHSPLLLNHFAAEEVLIVTRSESGVQVQPMSGARGLDDLATEMSLGELWYNVGDSNLARPA